MAQHWQSGSGGAATHAGINFQDRVGAWVFTRILAESPAAPIGPVGLPVFVRIETPEPTDDLLIGTADRAHAFVQAKRRLGLSGSEDSEFASVIDQFVRQFLSSRDATGTRPWSQPLDPNRDRLILVTTSASPGTVRQDLREVLIRVSNLTDGQPAMDAAVNQKQRAALGTTIGQVSRSWRHATRREPTPTDIACVLRLIKVAILDVETNGVSEREALELLASSVVAQPDQAGAAWAILMQKAGELSQHRSGTDQDGLRRTLEGSGILLKSPPRFDEDIAKLRHHARQTLQYLSHHAKIPVSGREIRVARQVVDVLRSSVEMDSLVVVGVPGAGKSAALHDVADSLLNEGRDVVFLAADQLAAKSLGEARNEIGLKHELIDVILNWPGEGPGILIMDALDAVRGDPASAALLTLIRTIIRARGRWHVLASIRKYDLRYSPELCELFRGDLKGEIPTELRDRENSGLRHVNVSTFSDDELNALGIQAPQLASLLTTAPQDLHELMRVPFNLRLAAEILDSGVDLSELRPIRTQTELLDRYWQYRVLKAPSAGLREQVLRRACDQMIRARRLLVDRQSITEPGLTAALEELLSDQVLMEWQPPAAAVPYRQIVTFSHHIIFDFAVSKLFLPPETHQLVALISSDPDLIIMIRPSLVMKYQQLWNTDRDAFWSLLFKVCLDPRIPQFGKLIGASVAAESGRTLADFAPILDGLRSNDAV